MTINRATIESETDTPICPGCQRLIAIEWPANAEERHTPEQIEFSIAA